MPENDENLQQERQQPTYRYNFDTIEEYLSTSEHLARDQRLDEGVDILREAVERYPDSAMAHYNLGVAIFMKLREDLAHLELWENLADDEEFAEECHWAFQAAIERDRGLVPAYKNLGTLLALRGRVRKAIEVWEQALALDPDQPDLAADLEMYRSQLEEDDVLRRGPDGQARKSE
jgi:tetratricopeptide (TPR) repeat protein